MSNHQQYRSANPPRIPSPMSRTGSHSNSVIPTCNNKMVDIMNNNDCTKKTYSLRAVMILWCLTSCAFGMLLGVNYGMQISLHTSNSRMIQETNNSKSQHKPSCQTAIVENSDENKDDTRNLRGGNKAGPAASAERNPAAAARIDDVSKEFPKTLSYHYGYQDPASYFTVTTNKGHSIERPIVEPIQKDEFSKTAAICSVFSGNERYLNEWLDYHVAIGFSTIYIYDNFDQPFVAKWLDENRPGHHVSWSKYIRVVHWPGSGQTMPAIRDCTDKAIQDKHTWAAYFDEDEYMVIKKHQNVVEYLNEYLPSGSININWQLFGPEDPNKSSYGNLSMDEIKQLSEGRVAFHTQHLSMKVGLPSPLIQRNQHMIEFPTQQNGKDPMGSKVILHLPSYVKWPMSIPHMVEVKDGTKNWNTEGMALNMKSEHPWKVYSSGEIAILHHYRFKSIPEYIYESCSKGKENDHSTTYDNKAVLSEKEKICNEAVQMMEHQLHYMREVYDDSAWTILQDKIPWYRQFSNGSGVASSVL